MAGSQKEFELLFKLKASLGGNFNSTFKSAINTNNGQVDVAHEYILEIYKECMRTNDFALSKPKEP